MGLPDVAVESGDFGSRYEKAVESWWAVVSVTRTRD